MDYAAIDLHKKESQIRIVTEGGEIVDRRICHDPRPVDGGVLGLDADADSGGGLNRE